MIPIFWDQNHHAAVLYLGIDRRGWAPRVLAKRKMVTTNGMRQKFIRHLNIRRLHDQGYRLNWYRNIFFGRIGTVVAPHSLVSHRRHIYVERDCHIFKKWWTVSSTEMVSIKNVQPDDCLNITENYL